MSFTTITVTGKFSDMLGNAASGSVTFTPNRSMLADSDDGIFFPKLTYTATLDDTGAFSITLACTDNAFTVEDSFYSSWMYSVSEQIEFTNNSYSRSYNVCLPSTLGSSVDLSSLAADFANI